MHQVADSVRNICRNLSIEDASRPVLQTRLNRIAEQIDIRAASAGMMSTSLSEILDLYSQADRSTENVGEGAEEDLRNGGFDGTIPVDVSKGTTGGAVSSGNEWWTFAYIDSLVRNAAVRFGVMTLGTLLENFVTDLSAEAIANVIYSWTRQTFPVLFMDRGMIAALANGGEMLLAESPSWLTSVVRSGSKWLVPIIGTAIDYGVMVIQGEDTGDALIKAGTHTAIGLGGAAAGAKIGLVVGTVVPVAGNVIGIVAGAVIGAAGSVAFDYVYDNWDDISEWTGSRLEEAGNWIGERAEEAGNWIGDRAEEAGNWIGDRAEEAGNWLNDTGAAIGDFWSGLGNAFSFSW